jgi:hypothetical protein
MTLDNFMILNKGGLGQLLIGLSRLGTRASEMAGMFMHPQRLAHHQRCNRLDFGLMWAALYLTETNIVNIGW